MHAAWSISLDCKYGQTNWAVPIVACGLCLMHAQFWFECQQPSEARDPANQTIPTNSSQPGSSNVSSTPGSSHGGNSSGNRPSPPLPSNNTNGSLRPSPAPSPPNTTDSTGNGSGRGDRLRLTRGPQGGKASHLRKKQRIEPGGKRKLGASSFMHV